MLDFLGVVRVPVDNGVVLNLTTSTSTTATSSRSASLATLTLLLSASLKTTYLPALTTLLAAYPALAPHFPNVRQRAWIITTIASLLMTLSSLPFFLDFAQRSGVTKLSFPEDLGVVPRMQLAVPVNRFFQAYLTADMIVGGLCYRSQIGFLTGWIHHIVYLGIVEVAIRYQWAHFFCLAAFMELPTFLLGLSTLLPALRSNALFALTFFATRICFHVVLMTACAMTNTLRTPACILLSVFPLHVMWFKGCVAGFIRRYKVGKLAAKAAEGVVVVPSSSSSPTISTAASTTSNVHPLTHYSSSSVVSATTTHGVEWTLRRLRAASSALLERGSPAVRWLGGPGAWVGAGGEERMMMVGPRGWLARGRDHGRWGVRKAILERLSRPRRPIRPRATMMARRVSARLLEVVRGPVLDAVRGPVLEVVRGERVMGYVRGLQIGGGAGERVEVEETRPVQPGEVEGLDFVVAPDGVVPMPACLFWVFGFGLDRGRVAVGVPCRLASIALPFERDIGDARADDTLVV
ncbi:hypothetical protein R3P38DRAFT_3218740 [Favolaschia claudopus]|uniref:TLC domain-containing protein n=1 Tax=Favolaschia claudopus TaxID=2862362 RepID=A0AAW0A3D7_9AGAR